jgi:hypothetical protein
MLDGRYDRAEWKVSGGICTLDVRESYTSKVD